MLCMIRIDECRRQASSTTRAEGEISKKEERALPKGFKRKTHQVLVNFTAFEKL